MFVHNHTAYYGPIHIFEKLKVLKGKTLGMSTNMLSESLRRRVFEYDLNNSIQKPACYMIYLKGYQLAIL